MCLFDSMTLMDHMISQIIIKKGQDKLWYYSYIGKPKLTVSSTPPKIIFLFNLIHLPISFWCSKISLSKGNIIEKFGLECTLGKVENAERGK